MRITFAVKALRDAVGSVGGIVTSKVKDTLRCVKIAASSVVSLSATDSEVSIVRTLSGEIARPGEVLLEHSKLAAILREVTSESITIDCVDGIAHIAAGFAKFKIQTKDPSEFPASPVFDADSYWTVAASLMASIVKRCVFYDDKPSRTAMNGIAFDFEGSMLNAVTTDSRALVVVPCEAKMHGTCDPLISVLLPKALKLIGSILDDATPVDIHCTPNSMKLRIGDTVISAQSLDGFYPKWRRVYPEQMSHEFAVVPSVLASTIKQAMITTSEESKTIMFHFGGGKLTLASSAADIGESSVEMPITFEGEMTVRLDPSYLVRCLALCDSPSATLGLINPDSPVRVTTDDGLRYIQMPCSVE